MASELKESQQKLTAKVDELTANVDRLTGRVPNLKEVAGLQSAQDGPIRPPETLPPPTA